MPPDDIYTIRTESVRSVYQQAPLTLGVSAANALIAAAVLVPNAGQAPVAAWLAAYAVMIVLRGAVWLRWRRAAAGAVAAPFWTHATVAGSLVSGLLWAACTVFLMPPQEPYPLFMAFVIGGMCAGAVTVNAVHVRSVAAFVIPAVTPLVLWFAWNGGEFAVAMALMTALFGIAMLGAAWRRAATFAEGVHARIALAERTAELAQANARLRAEIAERESAEAALRHSQKMEALGSLTAGVAHDVNNVLTVIRGAAEVLRHRLAYAPGHLRQVAAILRATDRGGALTKGLLAFARKETLQPDLVDVNALLRGIATLLNATLGESVHVVLDLNGAVPPVFIDRGGLEHAIINLAINARDAMAGGGTLTFRTALRQLDADAVPDLPAGEYVTVDVADTGTGMTPTVAARAFDPFFTTKPAGKGSGLGLSQVYGLIRQSGGAARIDSAPGAGTVVRLHLPRADAAQIARGALREQPPRPHGEDAALLHIVLLDDEDLVREVVAELLEGAGHRVSAFARAGDALRCIETDPNVALLITDLGLPDCPGEEVARRARHIRPSLSVLFITGYNDVDRLREEKWQLQKPFGEAELLAMVADAARQSSPAA